jgi:hypothetical protein
MENIIFLYGVLGISILTLLIYMRNLSYKKRFNYVIRFKSYISVLNYYLEKAYDIIHKDKLLIYSLEATKPDEKMIQNHSKEFAILVMSMIGPMLLKEFKYLYGDESTFYFNLLEYFDNRFEDDEIRKTALDNLAV